MSKRVRQTSDGHPNQTTLKSFFVPVIKGSEKSTNSPVNTPLGLDSSDEDELVALDQILRPGASHNVKKVVKEHLPSVSRAEKSLRRSRSPEIETYNGAFNLTALVADRNQRNQDKEVMSRLANQTKEANERPKISRATADAKVEKLLQMNREKHDTIYWSAFDAAADADNSSGLAAEAKERLYAGTLATYVRKHGCKSGSISRQLLQEMRTAENFDDCRAINRVLISSTKHDRLCLNHLGQFFDRLGIRSGHIVKEPVALDALLLQKLRLSLGLFSSPLQGPTHTHNFCQILALSLDSTYGPCLVAEIETALLSVLKHSNVIDWDEYLQITNVRSLQAKILSSIPISEIKDIEFCQNLASVYFLNDSSVRSSHEKQLKRCLEGLHEPPFHPITSSTDYQDLLQRVNILSYAMLKVAHTELTRSIIANLQELHGKIIDGKAAFIVRSEAKAAIQRLAYRLKYTLDAGTKTDIFSAS